MRILIAAAGRWRATPLRAAYDDYAARLPWPVTLREFEERRQPSAAQRKAELGDRLLAAVPADTLLIALDPQGKRLSSEGLAERLAGWRDAGTRDLAFAIGGADGLAEPVLRRAALTLSFGAMTWPHLLVRVMLVEQLYRASTILSGHPYHRG